jgi:sugar/nucleoside kinase (ribokinase family)
VIGTDENGKQMVEAFREDNVLVDFVEFQGEKTNLSTVLSFQGERTIFQFHAPRKYVLPENFDAKWLYLTSMNEGFEDTFPSLIKLVKERGLKVFYNPGTFQLRAGLDVNLEMFKVLELLVLNKEEAQRLVGDGDMSKLLHELKELGPAKVVITDGRKGACAINENGEGYFLNEFPGDRIESTGAGDSFGCGLISGLYLGRSLVESMKLGAVEASSVVSEVGAQAGLLTLDECDKRLASLENFEVQRIF